MSLWSCKSVVHMLNFNEFLDGSSISGDSTASSDHVECRIGKAVGAFASVQGVRLEMA